ncbi:hypothetical protein JIG36_12075 [Actinoplanes sp. LDG1-06]|uniref:Uncharacterized protein n=1 Tax=Paractinoplanes ovalisporus TaxID=2810368 RepID=A0ABS2AAL8_9ACTN|nr:hypothetical protein [Actinoplanes ovalisporus]MBM2616294.1 hypothetical protein [Actinoplanes ovalisporus]
MTRTIHILDPDTGLLVRVCRGPSAAGACPLAGPDGVVPCAGFLVAPAGADPEYWPLPIPLGYRHCDVTWNERARSGLDKAERAQARWQAGLDRELRRVRVLAGAKDPRYRRMTDRDLEKTALWRWRLTGEAQSLRRSQEKNERQAQSYLAFMRYRRASRSVRATPPA